MAKRVADKYITDQNWDQDDQEENEGIGICQQTSVFQTGPGEFRKADEDVLKSRVIRKAKRRVTPAQGGSSAFSGFAGLKSTANSSNGASGGFRGFNLPSNGAAKTFQSNQANVVGMKPEPVLAPKVVSHLPTKTSDEEDGALNSREYSRHLSALNRSVSDWIKNHVEKNPLCDLTPIFLDYKKHLADIDEKFGHSDSEASQSSTYASDSQEHSSQSAVLPEKPKFSLTGFGSKTDSSRKDTAQEKIVSADVPAKPMFAGFSTGGPTTTTSPFKGFNTGRSGSAFPGFSFSSSAVGSGGSKPQKETQQKQDEEEYVPPKPESNIVIEDDAFFDIRCKLFYKKDDSYADRGVGQLYLKPSGTKTQLLIRADTATSQILLNILLAPSIPVKKQGKNNILIMCIPNPPINEKEKDKVTPLLIRVKTSDDADKLLDILEQKKKEAADAES